MVMVLTDKDREEAKIAMKAIRRAEKQAREERKRKREGKKK